MKCLYCGGRGWSWVGVASNAERQPCEPCGSRGRMSADPGAWAGLILLLVSALFSLGVILYVATAAFGQTHPNDRSLKWFRSLEPPTQTALVAGAMAAVGHLGLRCPEPITVGEQVAQLRLQLARVDESWISVYFQLITKRGCRVVDNTIDPKEGA